MTDTLYHDPFLDQTKQRQFESAFGRWNGQRNRYSQADAQNASQFAREHPDASPDVVAAVAHTGIAWNDNTITQVVAADKRQQTFLQQMLTKVLGPVTRPLFAGFQDIYNQGVSRPYNQIVRYFQGESYDESLKNSGVGIPGQMLAARNVGMKTTLGQGILPGMNRDPLMAPGASDVLVGAMEAGLNPQQAKDYTTQWVEANIGRDLMAWNREVNESTMLHKTKDGVTQAYNNTPGRFWLQPFTEIIAPDTAPYDFLTGTVDVFHQIALDPSNVPLLKLTRIARARRTAIAAGERAAEATPAQVAAGYGGTGYDGVTSPSALHGGAEFEGPMTRGGITRNVEVARRHASERVYLFDPKELPPSVKSVYDETGSVEQIFAEKSIAEVFDNIDPNDLTTRARAVQEAQTQVDQVQADLWSRLGGEDGLGWLADEMAELVEAGLKGDAARTPTVFEGDTFGSYDDVRRWIVENFDEGEDLAKIADDVKAMQELMATDDIFGAGAKLTKEQDALVRRVNLHTATGEMVFGKIDEALVPTASFTPEEFDKMGEWGYFFKTRDEYESYARHLDRIKEAGAVKSRGQWFIHPQTFDRWLGQTTGGKAIKAWVARTDFAELYRMFPGMDEADVLKLADLTDEVAIEAIIKQWYGSAVSGRKVPRRYENPLNAIRSGSPENGAAAVRSNATKGRLTVSQYGRRLTAQMGNNTIDPYNFSDTFDTVVSWAGTLAVDEAGLNRTLRHLLNEKISKREGAARVVEDMLEWLGDDLKRLGYSDREIRHIFKEWKDVNRRVQNYASNAAVRPLPIRGPAGRRIKTKFGDLDIIPPEPILDSQLGTRQIFVPNIRQVRRSTSRLRTLTDHQIRARRGLSNPGLSTSQSQSIIDGMLHVWRNMALLRPGWIMRVIPDEMGRFYAYGYSDMAQNPLGTILMSLHQRGDILPNGESISAMLDNVSLGADNGMFRGAGDVARVETNTRGANWMPQEAFTQNTQTGKITLTEQGAKGVARQFIQLNQSELAKVVADHATIDDALAYFKTDEGKEILRVIGSRSEDSKILGQAVENPEKMRELLQLIEGQRHQFTGGSWIGRGDDGIWVDMYGNPVETYVGREWTRAAMKQELDARGVQNVPSSSNQASLRSKLTEDDGNPADLLNRPSTDKYIITNQGDPDLLDLIRHGRTQRAPDLNRARVSASHQWFTGAGLGATRSDYVWVVGPTEGFNPRKATSAYRDLSEASGKVKKGETIYAIDKESLPPSVFTEGNGSGRRIKLPEERAGTVKGSLSREALDDAAGEVIEKGETQFIKDDMTKDDFDDFEQSLMDAYSPERPPPTHVRVPDKPYLNAADEKGLIDDMFRWIGQNPSMFATRRPFVTLRTWELIADQYVFADKAIRAQLFDAAYKADVGQRFERFINDALDIRGMKAPEAIKGGASVDEITNIAWTQAVGDTKDLFYDLTKGGAWQDGARLAFPFADAWWEVLSRWGGLMNPVRQGGRPLKLGRRIQQLNNSAENEGYFETSGSGERVFNLPGAGMAYNLLHADSPVKFKPQTSIDQLLFVDFGNPSSALKPGSSPLVQVTGAFVRPFLPPSWKPFLDVPLYGDFSPPERSVTGVVGAFLPTWMRRVLSKVLEGEFDRRYGSMQIYAINSLTASADPTYRDAATDPDAARKVKQEAANIAGWMATVDIFTSMLTPAQPQNVVSIVGIDADGTESLKSIAALAPDFALMRQIYGQEQALDYMLQMYGVDPLQFAPTSWAVTPRPVTREAELFLQENPHMKDEMPFTLLAWLPIDEGEFYSEAWRNQFMDGSRERLSPEDATYYISHVAGSHRMQRLREQRDAAFEEVAQRYGGDRDNDGFRYMRDEVINPWYQDAYKDIYLQYWAFSPGRGVTGLTARPSYKEVIGELRTIATPGTAAYRTAANKSPEVHDFVKFAMEQWTQAEALSQQSDNLLTWWSTSDAKSGEAQNVRDNFASNINVYLGGMSQDARTQAEWIVNTIFTPLLTGFDFENPIIIAPTTASIENVGIADKLNER